MFKLAVVGPFVTRGFGVARQCLTCHHFKAPQAALPCFGFGSGCLAYQPVKADAAREAAHKTR